MHITLKEHSALTESFGPISQVGYYAREVSQDNRLVTHFLTSWQGTSIDSIQEYVNQVRIGPCYALIIRKDEYGGVIDWPIPQSLVEAINEEDKGTAMQFVKLGGTNIPGLSSYANLGDLVYAVPDIRYTKKDPYEYLITDGLAAGMQMMMSTLEPYDENLVRPYELVYGKVIAEDSSTSVLTSSIGQYLPLAKQVAGSVIKLYITEGRYINNYVPSSAIQLAATPEEAILFARKAVHCIPLLVGPKAREAVMNQGNFRFSEALLNMVIGGSHQIGYLAAKDYSLSPSNYWEVDKEDYTRVSFLPQSKVEGVLKKGENPWDCSSRQTTTWAKLARSHFNVSIFYIESHYEAFSNNMVAAMGMIYGPEELRPELIVVHGEDIAKYYSQDTYAEKKGDLGNSCMRHVPSTFFAMYTQNPDQVGLLILRDRHSNKISGRALVWTADDGTKWVDRRYGTSQVEQTKLLNWAEANGYQNLWGGHHTPKAGVRVTLPNAFHVKYPYMDSMCNLDVDTGVLSSMKTGAGRWSLVKCTGGTRTSMGGEIRCASSGVLAPNKMMVKTASDDYAFAQYLDTLKSGKKELKSRCVEDELEGGMISKKESVPVFQGDKLVNTSRNSSLVVLSADFAAPMLKERMVFSALDRGFILKEHALLMPDGKYCSIAKQALYLAMLSRRKVNQAKVTVAAVAATPYVAVAA